MGRERGGLGYRKRYIGLRTDSKIIQLTDRETKTGRNLELSGQKEK